VGGIRVATTRYRADAVVTCDAAFSVHRPGAVDVADGEIAWVGPAADAPPLGPDSERHLSGLLMPGLVNVHSHSPMTLFRGAAEDLPLQRFLEEILWPREARLQAEDVYWGMTLACAELLRNGVTTTCEMYFHDEAVLEAVVAAGSRCMLTPGVLDVPGFTNWPNRLDSVLRFHDQHTGAYETVRVGLAPHSAYALPLEALVTIGEAARDRDALVHIHVAETKEEGRPLEEQHGQTVPALLADIGLLDGHVLAAHCVWLTDDDLRIFREHDVAIAHCPQSNAKLADGVAPLAEMLEHGLRVGLGTDGPASNNDLDLWEEMRLAPLLARIRTGDPEAVPARDALALATRRGGEALGWSEIGVLEAGRAADLVLLRMDNPLFVPLVEERDVLSHLLWSASSRLVTDVWVAGKHVVEAGVCRTVDEERARHEVQERAVRLAGAA
jgi:5-methylthioadenosine/S-adenosylhomocysteine deaminase